MSFGICYVEMLVHLSARPLLVPSSDETALHIASCLAGTRPSERLTQKAYDWRLRAVPYHYTAFYDAHTNGCSVMRPLFFSWPSDTASLLIDRQWMLGDAIMVAPILLEGTDTVPAYFPAGKWYDLYNHSSIDTSAAAQHLPVMVNLLSTVL